jgi:UDP-galactopyranose mutase
MKILVVGAGFSGATVARQLAEKGYLIDLIDKKDHIAGNAYDYTNEFGIRIHQYGPHLFHTSNDKVVAFLSRFTEWVPYKHKVKAMLSDGRLVTLPVNQETAAIVGAENVLDIFFRPYSKKMWNLELEAIDKDTLNRVPIRSDDNEYYFPNDTFQAMPKNGYTSLIGNMIDHPNINLRLNRAYSKEMETEYDHIFNAMPIDEYFEFKLGNLPYRSIIFHTYTLPIPTVFPVATVNFTHHEKFTRVTEWKNIPGHGINGAYTTLTVEEPCDYKDNNFERYYPVKDIHNVNRTLYQAYQKMVPDKVTFIGRCGLYAYLDMHQAVNSAMAVASNFAPLG